MFNDDKKISMDTFKDYEVKIPLEYYEFNKTEDIINIWRSVMLPTDKITILKINAYVINGMLYDNMLYLEDEESFDNSLRFLTETEVLIVINMLSQYFDYLLTSLNETFIVENSDDDICEIINVAAAEIEEIQYSGLMENEHETFSDTNIRNIIMMDLSMSLFMLIATTLCEKFDILKVKIIEPLKILKGRIHFLVLYGRDDNDI